MKYRFSVVMPVYNREKYLRQAIDSVLSQTFTDYEIIAVDDGSIDGSPEILQGYGDRIKTVRQLNQGPEVARNTGAAIAQGEYIAFLDSDDILFPRHLEIYDRIIRNFNSPALVIGTEHYYRDGQEIPSELFEPRPVEVLVFKDYLAKTVSITCVGTMLALKKSIYDEVGGHRHSTAQTWYGDTYDLLLRVGTYGPCIFIREPRTFAYRVHPENSLKQIRSHAGGALSLVEQERLGMYPGGRERFWDRYAIIGGFSSTWALKYCWRGKQRKLAFQLVARTLPMILAALVKKSLRYFRKSPQHLVFSLDSPIISCEKESEALALRHSSKSTPS